MTTGVFFSVNYLLIAFGMFLIGSLFIFFANTFCILCILTMCYKYFSQFVYHYVTQFPIYFNPPCKQLECLHNMPECEREGIDQLLPLGGGCVLVAQLCLTLCNPTDCTPPGSSVHGIFQAKIRGWLVVPFARRSPDPGIKPRSSALTGGFFTV